MPANEHDPYRILGVQPGASPQAVREAFRSLARRYHPDLNPDPRAGEQMRLINWAYEQLNPLGQRRVNVRPHQGAPYTPPPDAGTHNYWSGTRPPGASNAGRQTGRQANPRWQQGARWQNEYRGAPRYAAPNAAPQYTYGAQQPPGYQPGMRGEGETRWNGVLILLALIALSNLIRSFTGAGQTSSIPTLDAGTVLMLEARASTQAGSYPGAVWEAIPTQTPGPFSSVDCLGYMRAVELKRGQIVCLQGPLLAERGLVEGGWLLYIGVREYFIKTQADGRIDAPPHIPEGGCVQVVGRFSLVDGKPVLRVEKQGAVRACEGG